MYECKGGHLACMDCCGECPGNQRYCQKCERGGNFNVCNTEMDAVLSSARLRLQGPAAGAPHHIITVHPMPVHMIQYGMVLQLQVSVSEPWRLLFMEDDGRTFFIVGGALDIGVPIVVLVVYIRAGASPLPHCTVKVWANGPPGVPKGRTIAIKVEIEVTSSKEPGDVTVEELNFFIVPPKLLVGARYSRMVSLHIQIDKLTS
ncbi:uncharacterized protein [Aegilops tauschii subsp. strangulata]|uniref:uncharacterized protein n=1 Tax=Aegilops tauschii subsp. strangulata TaxID=200361 RepID=UPI003CC8B596